MGTFDSNKQEITSPNFPNEYNVTQNCSWIINAPANSTIKLSFLEFALEVDDECAYDFLQIDSGPVIDSSSTGEKLCGLMLSRCEERILHSKDGGVSLFFLSDINIVAKGFHINFEIMGQEKGMLIIEVSSQLSIPLNINLFQ